jgi:sulfur-oxidizing protein SoxY
MIKTMEGEEMKPSHRNLVGMLVLALTVVWFGGSAWATNLSDTWSPLKQALFGDRPIQEGMIQLEAPEVAQDAATVAVSIKVDAAQSAERFVKTLHLIVDRNPIPIAAIFHLTPDSGLADLSTRIRLQTFSPVRAIAEMNDGSLYMSARLVQASGGCTAPVGKDDAEAKTKLGEMRLRTEGDITLNQPNRAQLLVRHPQHNGLQRDLSTGFSIPPDYITSITLSYGGKVFMKADTGFALSQDPSLHFYFVPQGSGALVASITDTANRTFAHSVPISPEVASSSR